MAKRLIPIAFILGPLVLFVVGEINYASQIRPTNVDTVAQHFERFGLPQFVRQVRLADDPGVYYELEGFPGGAVPWFALPSSAPAYVYDQKGALIDWCADPGDQPQHNVKWSRVSAALDVEAFRQRFVQ